MAAFSFSPDQRRTLSAICDALLPRLSAEQEREILERRQGEVNSQHLQAWCRSCSSDLGIPQSIEESVSQHLPKDAQSEFSLLLTALGSRVGMLLLCGVAMPFAALDEVQRERALQALQGSAFSQKRKAFVNLKNLTLVKAFARDTTHINPHNNSSDLNSMWAAMDFEGPAPVKEVEAVTTAVGRTEFQYAMLNDSISADTTLSFDVVVVGSGCGGSVVAAEMAQAGRRVLVVEKARYRQRAEVTGVEGDALDQLYERGGLVSTEDTGMACFSGSAFGGGSAVNWACCLRTPDYVKQEWASKHGLQAFTDGTFDAALDAVTARIGVKSEGVAHSRNNELFAEACKTLGYHIDVAPQNMADVGAQAPGAHFIGCGDRYGNKQSTPETFLRDAATAPVPATFADRCFVERVMQRGGVAEGILARIVGADGVTGHTLTVRAPIVVISCGSLHSPAMLLKSGLPNHHKQIGKNLRLHPVTAVNGYMPHDAPDVALWRGAPMTTVSNEVAKGPSGDGYGAKLECPLALPGIASLLVPWQSGHQFKDLMLDYRRTMSLIVLQRDRGSGEVRLDKQGNPRLYYKPSDYDLRSLADGVERAIRLVAAAGAERLVLGQFSAPLPLPPPSDAQARSSEVERIIAEVRRIGFPLFQVPLFSAHHMGTCRMGVDPKRSVVKPTCETWECSGLYVIDASTFPTSSGTNPMVTTFGIAHMAAQDMKRRQCTIPSRL